MRRNIVMDLLKVFGSSILTGLIILFAAGRFVGVSEAKVKQIEETTNKNTAEVAALKDIVIRLDQRMSESQKDRERLNRLMEENTKAHELILVGLAKIEAQLKKP